MSSVGAAPRAAVSVSSARAEASRKNGARSRGPRTAAGKARSARGGRGGADRGARARGRPADHPGAAGRARDLAARGRLFAVLRYDDAEAGRALIRDGHGMRSFETFLRYRGATQAELWRALRTLKALQAEARACAADAAEARPPAAPRRAAARPSPAPSPARRSAPNEPESRTHPCRPGDRANPGGAPRSNDPSPARPLPRALPTPAASALRAQPIEPETPGGSAPPPVTNAADREPSWQAPGAPPA